MRVILSILRVLGLTAIFTFLHFFAGAFTGAGHGTFYFLEMLMAPFAPSDSLFRSYVLFGLWPIVAILVEFRSNNGCRIAAAVLLILHYLGVALVTFREDMNHVVHTLEKLPLLALSFLILYFWSQIYFWWMIGRRYKPAEQT
jgi:hypothetical protein